MTNRSSIFLSDTSSPPIIHIILNITSLFGASIGTLLSFVMLLRFLFRRKTFRDVQLLLCMNSYFLVFLLGISLMVDNVGILRADYGLTIIENETLACRLKGYILFSLTSAVYLACVLQAVFRLCRIAYPTVLWAVEVRAFAVFIPVLWICSFLLIIPLFLWHGQKLIPGEHICRVTNDDPLSIAYSTLIVYGLPFNCLAFTYIQVHRFLSRQATSITFDVISNSRRRQRDLLVIRRTIILVFLLSAYGIPNAVMLIILAITRQLVPSFYRILQLSFSAIVPTLSIALFYINPQLRRKIRMGSPQPRGKARAIRGGLTVNKRILRSDRSKMTVV